MNARLPRRLDMRRVARTEAVRDKWARRLATKEVADERVFVLDGALGLHSAAAH